MKANKYNNTIFFDAQMYSLTDLAKLVSITPIFLKSGHFFGVFCIGALS